MNRNDYEHTLIRQARVSAEIAAAVDTAITEPLEDLLTLREIYNVRRVIILGCGDSWIAGYAAKPVFEGVANIETDVIRCIDFSRNLTSREIGDFPENPLVIGISVTGSASRLAEAMERATKYGAQTVAITNKPGSITASKCNHVIPFGLPEGMEMNPGSNTYNASILTLIRFALRLARARGTISLDEYNEMKKAPLETIRSFAAKVTAYEEKAFEIADRWKGLKGFDFVGDYGDYSTAYFGLAKSHESVGGYSMCNDSDTWMMVGRKAKDPEKIGRIIIANSSSPSYDSACRVIYECSKLKSPCLVITDSENENFPENCDVMITDKQVYSWTNPLVQHFPFDMVVAYIRTITAALNDGHIYRDRTPAYSNPQNMDGKRIWGSEIVII